MGTNHARVLSAMKGVNLVSVVDPERSRRARVAKSFGCQAVATISDLPDVDAAVVAVPSALHGEIGLELMGRGVNCLIEKPLALDRATSEQLIEAADSCDVILQVGHLERFNPAIRQLKEFLADETEGIEKELGDARFTGGRFDDAIRLFADLSTADDFEEFLTLPAYGLLTDDGARPS